MHPALLPPLSLLTFLLTFSPLAAVITAAAPRAKQDLPAGPTPIDIRIGGAGGVYFLAEPGPLVVDVEKRDRNRRGTRSELRAILVGPDRRVLQEATIPDDGLPADGKTGPPQRVRLSTRVDRKGVFGLNVTVSQDRYGENFLWGFHTNCPRYVIETSRGHRDERHQEPIVLSNPGRPGNVCFVPRQGAFGMELTNLSKGGGPITVYDGQGTSIETLQADAGGRASCTFPAAIHRQAIPWRLSLPSQQAIVNIDGVTRWERKDLYPDLSLWTPDPKSYFPLPPYRWILTPYRKTVYGRPGDPGEAVFLVHNNSDQRKTVQLGIEFARDPWPARLSAAKVVLEGKGAQEVRIGYTVPAEGQTWLCHLRATPAEDPDFSTYSTLIVKAGTAPAARPFQAPLVLTPYRHENEQFGYLPDYPTESQVYFSPKNRPFVTTSAGLQTWRDRRWTAAELRAAVGLQSGAAGRQFTATSTKVAFDRDGDVYLLAAAGRQDALLHSTDGGKTFSAYPIPRREQRHDAMDIEQFSGHNVPEGPPPILRYTQTAADPRSIWRRINDLELWAPKKSAGRLTIGEPILISKLCIGLASHSGIPSSVVSRGTKVHVVWAEATEPGVKVPGVPTYVVTYDRATGALGKPVLVAYGAPANDVHNSPSITIDSQGYLHVLAGTHGQPFPYARSLQPNTAHAGWTDPVFVGDKLSQTYIGLVCGPDDTLHLVYRLWRTGEQPFPTSHYAALAYQHKPAGKPWEAPGVLIVPPLSKYSVYYHRLTLDHRGRLFLSYDYWSTYWFYRMDHRGGRRALMMSADGGNTWKLAESRDLVGESVQ